MNPYLRQWAAEFAWSALRKFACRGLWPLMRDSNRCAFTIKTKGRFHQNLPLVFMAEAEGFMNPYLRQWAAESAWSALRKFACRGLWPLMRDSNRCAFTIKTKGRFHQNLPLVFMAEAEGFEPPWGSPKRFSRPPRYDHFDMPPYSVVKGTTPNGFQDSCPPPSHSRLSSPRCLGSTYSLLRAVSLRKNDTQSFFLAHPL